MVFKKYTHIKFSIYYLLFTINFNTTLYIIKLLNK